MGSRPHIKKKPQTTMVSQAPIKPDFIGLRTESVILKVNALLDDTNTKEFVSADITAELGLYSRLSGWL